MFNKQHNTVVSLLTYMLISWTLDMIMNSLEMNSKASFYYMLTASTMWCFFVIFLFSVYFPHLLNKNKDDFYNNCLPLPPPPRLPSFSSFCNNKKKGKINLALICWNAREQNTESVKWSAYSFGNKTFFPKSCCASANWLSTFLAFFPACFCRENMTSGESWKRCWKKFFF